MTKRKNGEGTFNKSGYHVFVRKGKFRYEHVEIAERILGRPLPKTAQVHHVDEVTSNNAHHNLVICPTQKYHRLLHYRTKALQFGGNANYLKCRFCGKYDDRKNVKRNGSRGWAHSECRSKVRRALYKIKSPLGIQV